MSEMDRFTWKPGDIVVENEEPEMSNLTSEQLAKLRRVGKAMAPSQTNQSDNPRFPISTRTGPNSLEAAIKAVGRARPNTPAERAKVRRYIMGVARQKGWSADIPSSWNSDGTLKSGGA
jgi:hypothetical protein